MPYPKIMNFVQFYFDLAQGLQNLSYFDLVLLNKNKYILYQTDLVDGLP